MALSNATVTVHVADVEPFAAIVKDATVLVNELNQPTFDIDALPPTALVAYQNLARALGVLSRRIRTETAPGKDA